jgi:predicted nuclease of predicted toxin-antitoxin system
VKLLLDNGLSPRLSDLLRGHVADVQHVREIGLHAASDATILAEALRSGRILITLDGDFPALLAHGGGALPSVIHLRTPALSRPEAQCRCILRVLDTAGDELAEGAIVSVREDHIRCRRLPIRSTPEST